MTQRPIRVQQFTLLLGMCGLLAVSAQFACDDDPCMAQRSAYFRSMEELEQNRIETFDEARIRQGATLTADQEAALDHDGRLFGVLRLDRPVKHRDGGIEMPAGWLPDLPEGHPWTRPLTITDDAFYSWFEERIVEARLYDPANATHRAWAQAYLAKAETQETFTGWSYAAASCKSY